MITLVGVIFHPELNNACWPVRVLFYFIPKCDEGRELGTKLNPHQFGSSGGFYKTSFSPAWLTVPFSTWPDSKGTKFIYPVGIFVTEFIAK